MVDFTTKIEQNTPGLTYSTPKEMPSKFNNLTSTLNIIDKGITAATAFDKKLTIDEVTDAATLEAQQYLNQSPSEQLFLTERKQEIEANLRLNPNSSNIPVWKARLKDINTNLSNAKDQGQIDIYEFGRRSNAKIQEIIEDNPAYRDEIISETQKVYESMGLSDVLAADKSLLDTQEALNTRQSKELDKFLLDQKIYPYNKDLSEKSLIVEQILQGDRSFFLLTQMSERGDILDEEDKRVVQGKVENFTYGTEQGYNAVSTKIFHDLGKELRKINISSVSPEEKVLNIQNAIQTRRKSLNYIGRNHTKGNKDRVTRWYDEQIKIVEMMEKDSRELNSGEFTKKYLEYLESSQALTNKLGLRQFVNVEAADMAIKLRAFILKETKENPDFNPTIEELQPINDFLSSVKSSNGGKVSASSNAELNNFYGRQVPEKLRGINILLGPAIKEGTEIDISAKGYMNNLFTVSEIKGAQEGDTSRMQFDDQLFTSLAAMDSNVINHFVTNEPDFSTDLEKELDFYKTRTQVSLNNIKSQQPDFKNQKVPVQFYKGLGMFGVPTNKALGSEIQRVNKYIRLLAKQIGVKPNTIAEEILEKDFPMFTLGTKPVKETIDLPPLTSDSNFEENDPFNSIEIISVEGVEN